MSKKLRSIIVESDLKPQIKLETERIYSEIYPDLPEYGKGGYAHIISY